MTTEGTDDVLHFRGKTLTPESPRPVHISEPATIPVLENQTEPAFNTLVRAEDKDLDSVNVASEVEDPVHLTKHVFSRTYELFRNNDTGTDKTAHHIADEAPGSTTEITDAGSEPDTSTLLPTSADDSKQYTSSVPNDHSRAVSKSTLDYSNPSDAHSPAPNTAFPQTGRCEETNHAPEHPAHDQAANHSDDNDHKHPNDHDDGINFQSLLDNLSPPISTAPPLTTSTTPITSPPMPNASHLTGASLPYPSNLPPRPPVQEKSSINPSYSPTDNIRSFHPVNPQTPGGSSHTHSNPHTTLSPVVEPGGALGAPSAASGFVHAPPTQTQQHPPHFAATTEPHQNSQQGDGAVKASQLEREGEVQWGREVQKKYDDFLREERKHVLEGQWDRFPLGSRLFVGNLPTEKVTKRDLFHLFHKYGKLAQISIKQAYGFVQFVEASSCHNALAAEQGGTLRGRKIHLEISKPQRSTRHAPPNTGSGTRGSRSPESVRGKEGRARGRRPSTDRYDPQENGRMLPTTASTVRDRYPADRRRARDDYRPSRSPSPRPLRRERYRSRDRLSPERYDGGGRRRSRSPSFRRDRRYAGASSPDRNPEADLPIPKRSPRSVPDVQIIVLDNVDRQFIYRIERVFQDRGLRSDTLFLSPRIELSAVIHRQIVEGILAIVKISRLNQYSGKIPLQVFDRSGGANNVRFNEYSELDMNVAGDVVLHARNTQSTGASNSNRAPPTLAGAIPSQQPVRSSVAPSGASNNNIANLISSLDGPGLQALLGALQNQPQQQQQQQQQHFSAAPAAAASRPYPVPQIPNPTDLAGLIGSTSRANAPPTASHNPVIPPYGFNNPSSLGNQNLAALLSERLANQAQNQPHQTNPQANNIFNQLGKWKQ